MSVEPNKDGRAARQTACAHCGDPCPPGQPETAAAVPFCCAGCRTVYLLLNENGLTDFYRLDPEAGRSQRTTGAGDYAWLDVAKLRQPLLRYHDAEREVTELELPAIHCASCLWLLERLPQLGTGVLHCRVDIARKLATITYDPGSTSLRGVAELLHRIGYPPVFRGAARGQSSAADRSLLYRIGVAGFCFGNIMLLSFPEYLGLDRLGAGAGAVFFGEAVSWLILLLTVPVFFYAGRGFFTAALAGLRCGRLTIDVPIVIGMLALLGRSLFEIVSGTGPGYLDSLAGLVFFLLIGRWFQSYTFARLNFDRDYRDYFPVAARRLLPGGGSEAVAAEDLRPDDLLLIAAGQLIPADGTLERGAARIDYSFVTGEADPRPVATGQEVFAGGRAVGGALRVRVRKPTHESYLLQLWRGGQRDRPEEAAAPSRSLVLYFTLTVLLLAGATFGYWYPTDASLAYRAATAVLIVACPCALALVTPFAYGTLQRLLGRAGHYFRGAAALRRLAAVDCFVFDKTGTLVSAAAHEEVVYLRGGHPGAGAVFLAMAEQSSHPRSRALAGALTAQDLLPARVGEVEEQAGRGLRLLHRGHDYRIGSAEFCGVAAATPGRTYAAVDGAALLALDPPAIRLRPGIEEMLARLGERGPVYLLSGDHAPEQPFWRTHLRPDRIHFRMSPFGKQSFVEDLQATGKRVLMVGDGLNDAGALRTADVGVAVSEGTANFSPACDAIVRAERLPQLPDAIDGVRRLGWVVGGCFAVAFAYNVVGLSYAMSGTLSPVVAAILMPLSSVTVVALACLGGWLLRLR